MTSYYHSTVKGDSKVKVSVVHASGCSLSLYALGKYCSIMPRFKGVKVAFLALSVRKEG